MRKFFDSRPRVAVTYPGSVPWIALCLDGIRAFAQQQGGWRIFTSPPTLGSTGEWEVSLRSLRDWNGDAIIAVSSNESELEFARGLKIPTVNWGGGLSESHGIPRVMVDHIQAGRIAAEHLLERGLPHLAFFGWSNLWYSQKRQQGFVERAKEANVTCEIFLSVPQSQPDQSWRERLIGPIRWLESLPRPCGVFAVQDYRAQLLLEACEHTNLMVPEDIAIVGMDNNETICQHSVPTLTSIPRNSHTVGWETAALLQRMMNGEPAPEKDLVVPCDSLIARQSTDAIYHSDTVVRRAIGFLLENQSGGFNIQDIAAYAGVSKRTLETRFRRHTGESPHEYILKARIKRAQRMMSSPNLTLECIAAECGFGTYPTFFSAFKRQTGDGPHEFREKMRVSADQEKSPRS